MYACCSVILAVAIAVAAASYFVFTATNSGTLLALSGVLGFAACPAMCAAIGGSMWLANRIGRKNKAVNSVKETTEEKSCYAKNKHRSQYLENSV